MGIFRKLFGKSDNDRSEPEPDVNIVLPYETLTVAGTEAVSTCLRLREEGAGQITPVILGDPKNLGSVLEGLNANDSSPQAIIERSEGITMQSFLDKRLAEEGEYYRSVERGEWPQDATPSQNLLGHTDIMMKPRPLKRVAICRVPTPRSWEVPAYLCFGPWNESPTAEEHVALWRYWHANYGADIITLLGDVIECTVSRPPTEREQALALAWEQLCLLPRHRGPRHGHPVRLGGSLVRREHLVLLVGLKGESVGWVLNPRVSPTDTPPTRGLRTHPTKSGSHRRTTNRRTGAAGVGVILIRRTDRSRWWQAVCG